MSKKQPQQKAEAEGKEQVLQACAEAAPFRRPLFHRMAQATTRAMGRLLRLPTGRRFATSLLIALIAGELVVLGIGVTRKLGDAYRWETDLARTHLAVVEAQLLNKGLTDSTLTEGSAGIGAVAADAPIELPTQSSNEAPPLRPRDIQTIIEQETNGWDAEDDPVLRAVAAQESTDNSTPAPAPAEGTAPSPTDEQAAEDTSAAPPALLSRPRAS